MKLQLFKYYSPKYKSTWNLAFYEKRKIFFQQPINFNDPWDCKLPSLSIPRQENSLKDILYHFTEQDGSNYSSKEWERIKSLPGPQIKETLVFSQHPASLTASYYGLTMAMVIKGIVYILKLICWNIIRVRN